MLKAHFLVCLLFCASLLLPYVLCVGDNKQSGKRKSHAERMERTEGTQRFHEVKLARDLDLHSKTRQALATQIAEHSQDSNHVFNVNHGIEPVAEYFDKKIKKHRQNLKDLTFLHKLPGAQTVNDLKNKAKLPHNYEE
ncbi:uncharacterized protein FA14DRAFT_178888 [Meira miltonrushii]|uniref:Uncharacterized protein n=1 Tax=Meira miltonrushii TaxID=1280837 RepID=A0A316VD01_9BASI|nr:uncharacterized protein FA14DRAFT_178888 [Meira miltonrushii]PWN35519.1 hypothetical protein FA14DRAFT_178888 [Meira miltonrushii]